MFSRQEKITLSVLAFLNFTHIVDFMIMMPLGPRFMRLFDINPHQFGLLVSTYTFSAGSMAILTSFFVDRFDRKKNLLFFYCGFCISTLGCALSPTYEFLLFTRTMTGAFGGVMSSLVLAIVGDTISEERRGSAMGIIMLSLSAASVAGVPFSLFLATQFDWHAPFLFLGAVSFVLIFAVAFLIPPIRKHLAEPHNSSPIEDFLSVLKNSNQVRALLFMFCLVLGQFSVIPFISPSLVANAGVLEGQLQYIYLVGGICTFFSAPFVGRMSDRFGHRKVFYVGVFISLIPLYAITHQKPAPLYIILFFCALLFVALGSRMIPAMALIISTVEPKHRGTFMSLNSAVQQFSSAFASYLSGLIIMKSADGHLENYDRVGIFAIFFSILAIALIKKNKNKKHQHDCKPCKWRDKRNFVILLSVVANVIS